MSKPEPLRQYILADPRYYDRMERAALNDDLTGMVRLRTAGTARVDTAAIWVRCNPSGRANPPGYGWKVHISSRPQDIVQILDAVLDEYEQEPFRFKCVRDSTFTAINVAPWWPRGSAGKAVTVYPESVGHCAALLDRLSARLRDFDGPYILTDRRYRDSRVVHYRYGTFVRGRAIRPDGRLDNALRGPDGSVWYDNREPGFHLPPWITADPFADPAPRVNTGGGDLLRRYRIHRALRHSTAGGVYLATAPDGTEVVVKEARPCTSYATGGADAVVRLHREYDHLATLAGTGVAPRPLAMEQVWEHTFLVQEKVPGVPLQVWLARNHPHAQARTGAAAVDAFRTKVAGLLAHLRADLATCLDHGLVYGDVSLTNVLVDDDDVPRLIDFEGCRPTGADPDLYPRTTGFVAEPGSEAWRTDRGCLDFALAAVEAACLCPRNALLALDAATFGRALRHVAAELDWPIDPLVTELRQGAPGVDADRLPPVTREDLPALVADITRHVRASATPGRTDRLFPGHVEGLRTNGLSIAYGAAGVLRALHHLDGGVEPEHLRWLLDALDGEPLLPPGLYLGTAGIGVALLELGVPDQGAALLAQAARMARDGDLPADVATGRAGVGLALLAAADATGEVDWLARADEIGDRLVTDADDDGTGLWWPPEPDGGRSLGYLYGSAGVAAFLSLLTDATGEERYRTVARRALAFDLGHGRTRASGGLGFGARVGGQAFEPYVSRGGSGVGMAVVRLLAGTGDPALRTTLLAIVRGIGPGQTINPGLFSGMAGIVDFLLDCREVVPGELEVDTAVDRLVAGICSLRWPTAEGTAFPGDGLLRCSCDVASGAAGIALVLHRVATSGPSADLRSGRALARVRAGAPA